MSLDSHRTFNPRDHSVDLVSAFTRFTRKFGYIYDGENRSAPSSATTPESVTEWKDKDKAKLFLSRAVSDEFLDDFESAVTEDERTDIKFTTLVNKMNERYTPSSNKVRNHYLFHRLSQNVSENFDDFTHRVRAEAELCDFKCTSAQCTVKNILIRDQILVGTRNEAVRSEALKNQWDLDELLKKGRVTESSMLAASEIKSDPTKYGINRATAGAYSKHSDINRATAGAYSKKSQQRDKDDSRSSKFICWKCEDSKCAGYKKCKFNNKECRNCKRFGHSPKSRLCKANRKENEKHERFTSKRKTNMAALVSSSSEESENDSTSSEESVHYIYKERKPKILTIKVDREKLIQTCRSASVKGGRRCKPTRKICSSKSDFHTSVVINDAVVDVLVDTGADVNVISKEKAIAIGITWKKSKTKLRPYGSKPLRVCGRYEGNITFSDNIVQSQIFIVNDSLETLISGDTAEALGIITFHASNSIQSDTIEMDQEGKFPTTSDSRINDIVQKHSKVFSGIGKCKDKIITVHAKENAKPCIQPVRPIPFHLRKKFDSTVQGMIDQGVFEEYSGPSEWISNPVIIPKDDGSIRITVDYRNVNKFLLNTHCPIPRIDDLRASMNGCQYFSKLDLNQAFFQFEISEQSKSFTTFYGNGKLLRLNRLPQGLLPASSELNRALQQIFSQVPEVKVIHDDILIATESLEQQYIVIEKVLEIMEEHCLTLNGEKCIFASQDIPFWGMRFTNEGIKPCPQKCKALQEMEPPERKEDVASFVSMLQAHSRFIPLFSKLTKNIRELQKKDVKFRWSDIHQKEFDMIKSYFRESTTLSFFDPGLSTYIFVDASKGGLGAILAQGHDVNNTNVIAFASRTTTPIERRYPQIDLEAMSVDFGLRRFREYCVGAENVTVVTDHRPLKAIFENKRLGSIRIDRTKLRHQDIKYNIVWRAGKLNPSDYLSRHPLKATVEYENEATEDAKLLYVLHSDKFVLQDITIERIREETEKDDLLQSVIHHIHANVKPDTPELSYFKKIFHELTISATGLVLRQHRIVLPKSLHTYAISKAHSMGHFGCSGIKRQLRCHFDFQYLDEGVENEVAACYDCQLFTQKASKLPLTPVFVPTKAWEYVSIDFFGPMPGGEHVLVVQDLCTKYPAAVLLKKDTKAKTTINAIDRIFTSFGRPSRYRSDHGPPFDGNEFQTYMKNLGIQSDPSYPYRPQCNPVETWMKPLGKCLKIAIKNNQDKETAIRELLLAYRTTPHPATGLSPGEMLFRHGYRGAYPNRKSCTNKTFNEAVKKMKQEKFDRCSEINHSVKRKGHNFEVGQWVLVKDRRRCKFDPLFLDEPWIIESLSKTGVILHNPQKTKKKIRHADDVKPFVSVSSAIKQNNDAQSMFTIPKQTQTEKENLEVDSGNNEHRDLRRSTRRKVNTRDTIYKDYSK